MMFDYPTQKKKKTLDNYIIGQIFELWLIMTRHRRSPPQLLEQIVMVDDASTAEAPHLQVIEHPNFGAHIVVATPRPVGGI